MALTIAQRTVAQRILLDELGARRETQPLLLIDAILDGTAKAKLRNLLLAKQAAYQVTRDGVDADVVEKKASLDAVIGDLTTIVGEVVL
jgi:hypothetical protein